MIPKDIDAREGHVSDPDALKEWEREAIRTNRLHAPPTESDFNELYQAYIDGHGDYNYGSGKRSILYFSDAIFTAAELKAGFAKALAFDGDNGEWNYNEFDKEALTLITNIFCNDDGSDPGAIYQPARAYSVELLIHRDLTGFDLGAILKSGATKADEVSEAAPNVVRLWFD